MKTTSAFADLSRRQFLQSAVSAALAAPSIIPASALGRAGQPPPSDRINLGIIGVNGMGSGNLANCAKYLDVVVTAICDVSRDRREKALEQHKNTAQGYRDYRELLARRDVDAVIIASPPHWHALMAIDAVKAGKDIYLQKPMTLHPARHWRCATRSTAINGSARSAPRSMPARTTGA